MGDWPMGDWPMGDWPMGDWPMGDWRGRRAREDLADAFASLRLEDP
jgi:hypothetical protein